jgi:hypothetical protein
MRLITACLESKYLQAKRWEGSFYFLATLYYLDNGGFEIKVVRIDNKNGEPAKVNRNDYEGYADWEPLK